MLSEAVVQQQIQLEAPKHGVKLWRNNRGAYVDETGRQVRYGLANTSKKMNKLVKSSDLVGITPVVITADMVGQIVGVFTSPEVKPEGWVYKGTEHEQAQQRWHDIVNALGGRSGFVTSAEEALTL